MRCKKVSLEMWRWLGFAGKSPVLKHVQHKQASQFQLIRPKHLLFTWIQSLLSNIQLHRCILRDLLKSQVLHFSVNPCLDFLVTECDILPVFSRMYYITYMYIFTGLFHFPPHHTHKKKKPNKIKCLI